MSSLGDYIRIVEEEIRTYASGLSAPEELYAPIKYTLHLDAKRLRPAMTLIACDVFCNDPARAIRPALGIEVFHNFTLIHDDIMDSAPLRRGKPTVYKKWNSNTAILSGDVMLVKAYELISSVSGECLPEVMKVFNRAAIQVCEGQQLDMNFEERRDVSIEEYLYMIELKTSVLLAAALRIGAIIGGADKEQAMNLYEFGRHLGIAFQLQDDLLDTYADPDKFGKQVGGDIIANKKTYLLLKAMESEKDKHELTALMDDKEMGDREKISRVKRIFDRLFIREKTNDLLNEYHRTANQYLEKLEIEESKKSVFYELESRLMNREK